MSDARHSLRSQGGFTMVELLVVILVIGILAAIALPTFLGQQQKGQDAAAKSSARNLLTHVESCYVSSEDYRDCDSASDLGQMNLDYGSGVEQVEVSASSLTGYTISAHSRSAGDFQIVRSSGGVSRRCSRPGYGGCRDTGGASGSW